MALATHKVKAVFREAGIPVSNITRRNNPDKYGYQYLAEFFGELAKPAVHYIRMMQARLSGVQIVRHEESRRGWSDNSVIETNIMFDGVPALTRALSTEVACRAIVPIGKAVTILPALPGGER